MEYHIPHNRRGQAAAYDDNAAGPDRGSRHSSAVDYKTKSVNTIAETKK